MHGSASQDIADMATLEPSLIGPGGIRRIGLGGDGIHVGKAFHAPHDIGHPILRRCNPGPGRALCRRMSAVEGQSSALDAADAGRTGRFDEGPDDLAGLVARAASGDEQAWADLVQRYARRVYALAKSRLRHSDLAEEVSQSVFVTVFQFVSSGRYVERGQFEPWLFRIAMNRIRDVVRRSGRSARTNDDGLGERESRRFTDPSAPDELDRLRLAIASLSAPDQEIISLRHHAGLEFRAIAAMLDEPVGTLLARHHRALKKLKAILERMGAGDSEVGES
ncbi:MAG TPA: sigma-70 family RNA polymerase sigma factor [Phycisphaerales bacterium]|nr:sigma-70 family RNA polymerase sigma factor [Phycisphaerales bacterium]